MTGLGKLNETDLIEWPHALYEIPVRFGQRLRAHHPRVHDLDVPARDWSVCVRLGGGWEKPSNRSVEAGDLGR